ncbi:inhibin alpha chain isoform X1 [Pungitius pungitius]|uniref:inhibin alpha chain isoform X1 n=1 Tax=Pungitius pungitius TaxID=134920 RepID=UPI002E149CDA
MVSCALFVLGPLWVHILTQACAGDELSREALLSWFAGRFLERLGLEEAPPAAAEVPGARPAPCRAPRTSRAVTHPTPPTVETSEIILFPTSDSFCAESDASSHFTYRFQPSTNNLELLVTSAHFWFHAGEAANSSAQLFVQTSAQRPLRPAGAPSETSPDGWITYHLGGDQPAPGGGGPFLLQVRCAACESHADEPDKTPFLHLRTRPRGPVRRRRHAAATVPWSPSAVGPLRRPSGEGPRQRDCLRAELEISFEELGWAHWIVHPKRLTFYYCHGNCSASDRTTGALGVARCCAPVPGTMRSLRVTTTSDGGASFQYETLPNMTPEECVCF